MKNFKNSDVEIIRKFYQKIYLIRHVEEEISRRYKEQDMRCPVHLSIGQEAPAVGVCLALRNDDWLYSTHRSHAHYLAKGGNLDAMIAEIHGKVTGCNGGRGGSMHLSDLSVNMRASIPIIGSSIPLATGYALNAKIKKLDTIGVSIFGDASIEEGVFFECMNFASLHNLPLLYVCENNKFSIYTDIKSRQPQNRELSDIGKSFGISCSQINGDNVFNIYTHTSEVISRIRSGKGPHLMFIDTFRWLEHCGPESDDYLNYRNFEDISHSKEKCAVSMTLEMLKKVDNNWEKWANSIHKEIEEATAKSFKLAKQAALPKSETSWDHIYV